MNFLTAEVQIVVDYSKLNAQLAQVKQVVLKSTSVMEKSFNKVSVAANVVKMLVKTMYSLTRITLETVRTFTGLASVILSIPTALNTTLEIMKKIGFGAKSIAFILGKGTVWSVRKVGESLKGLARPMDKIVEKVKDWAKEAKITSNIWQEAAAKQRAYLDKISGRATTVSLPGGLGKTAEQMNNALKKTNKHLDDTVKSAKKSAEAIYSMADAQKDYNEAMEVSLSLSKVMGDHATATIERMEKTRDVLRESGQITYDVSGVMIEAYKKMYDAAKRTFDKILDVTTSVFRKIFDMSIWVKTGIVASFVGMYVGITKAAMDAEDAQAKIIGTVGTTRDVLKQMYDAIKYVAAAIGKPFLKNIKAISLAITGWLLENKQRLADWATTFVERLMVVQRAFIDWVRFLQTDFKGGVNVALRVVSELFKGFAEALIILMSYAGRRAGKALVDAFQGVVTSIMPSLLERLDKSLKWFGQKLMKSSESAARKMQRFTGVPSGPVDSRGLRLGGRAPTEAESTSAAILRVYRERAENIKQILKDMPTWGETEAKGLKAATDATTKYEKFNLELMQNDVKYTMDRMSAYHTMYDDMDKWNQKRYDNALQLLRREKADYIRAGVDRVTAYEWMNYQIMELDRKRAIASENFFAGFGAAVEQLQEDMITWGEIGATVAQTMESAFANAYYSMTSEGAKWADAMKGFALDVLRAFQRQLAAQTAAAAMAGIITPLLTGLGGLLGMGGIAPTQATGINPTASPVSLQHGGEVLKTGLAVVHKGETFSGEGGGAPKVTVNITKIGTDFETEVDEFQTPDEHVVNIVVRDIVSGGKLAQLTGAR